MSTEILVRESILIGYEELVAEFGGDAKEFYKITGLNTPDFEDQQRFFPFKKYSDLLEITARELIRPDFGLRFADTQNHEVLGPIAFLLLASSNVKMGIEDVAKYIYHLSPAIVLRIHEGEPSELCVELVDFGKMEPPLAVEHHVGATFRILEEVGVVAEDILKVCFRHKQLSPTRVYQEIFKCPVEFFCERNSIVMTSQALKSEIVTADSGLHSLVDDYLRMLQPTSPIVSDVSVKAQVSQILVKLMPSGRMTRSVIAERLGMDERTLHRKLKKEDSTYESLLEAARIEEVERLLKEDGLPMSQISGLLGYAEQSSFNRAFKRWYGITPKQYLAEMGRE